jgi:two-component system, NarL family, nitrate/nitrite response regulator NarL
METSSVVFVHPTPLFANVIASLLKAPFKLACIVSDVECVPFEVLRESESTIFVVGGRANQPTSKVIRSIRERLLSAIIIVIGDADEPRVALNALEAGANGYLREAVTLQTLMMTLDLALHNEIISAEAAGCLGSHPASFAEVTPSNGPQQGFESEFHASSLNLVSACSPCPGEEDKPSLQQSGIMDAGPQLTARELIILKGLANGLPNKVIAKTLAITEGTVKVHVKTVFRKIRAKNRTQAAVWAMKNINGSSIEHSSRVDLSYARKLVTA